MSGASDPVACENEPIHTPGSIQPFGVLLALDVGTLTVRHVSTNSQDIFGNGAVPLGSTAAEILGPAAEAALRNGLAENGLIVPRRIPGSIPGTGPQRWQGAAHCLAGMVFVELEPAIDAATTSADWLAAFVNSVTRLSADSTVSAFAATVAREVRSLTGYDRVMVYRFDDEWNGKVIAEERRADLETFLGLHYPASDIPSQARALFLFNRLRVIPDAACEQIPLVPDCDGSTDRVGDDAARFEPEPPPANLAQYQQSRIERPILELGNLALVLRRRVTLPQRRLRPKTGVKSLLQVLRPARAEHPQMRGGTALHGDERRLGRFRNDRDANGCRGMPQIRDGRAERLEWCEEIRGKIHIPLKVEGGRFRNHRGELARLTISAQRQAAHGAEGTLLSHRAAVIVHGHVAGETGSIRDGFRHRKGRRAERFEPLEGSVLLRILAAFAPRRDKGHENTIRMRRPLGFRTVVDASHHGSPHQEFDAESEHYSAPPDFTSDTKSGVGVSTTSFNSSGNFADCTAFRAVE